jgi:hypothetical protein
MNFRLSGQFFADVKVPILWGSRAILQDQQGHLSIINFEGDNTAVLEVIDDQPASRASFSRTTEGFVILDAEGTELYAVGPTTKSVTSALLRLPPITVGLRELRVGTNVFVGNMVSGLGVGIVVTEVGLALGGSLPPGLAALRV